MQIPQTDWARTIDVSQFNNGGQPIDWPAVVPHLKDLGITRVLLRASYGPAYEDPQFAHNWQSLTALQFPKGAYHAALPGTTPNLDAHAQQQSGFFLDVVNHVGGIQGDDWAILDLERVQGVNPVGLTYWAAHWLACVDAAVRNPANPAVFYSYPAFIQGHMAQWDVLMHTPLWLADYLGGSTLPTTAPPTVGAWTDYFGWQFSDSATVPGIAGAVDLSVFAVPGPTPTQPVAPDVAVLQTQVADLTTKITAAQKALQ